MGDVFHGAGSSVGNARWLAVRWRIVEPENNPGERWPARSSAGRLLFAAGNPGIVIADAGTGTAAAPDCGRSACRWYRALADGDPPGDRFATKKRDREPALLCPASYIASGSGAALLCRWVAFARWWSKRHVLDCRGDHRIAFRCLVRGVGAFGRDQPMTTR